MFKISPEINSMIEKMGFLEVQQFPQFLNKKWLLLTNLLDLYKIINYAFDVIMGKKLKKFSPSGLTVRFALPSPTNFKLQYTTIGDILLSMKNPAEV